jgi:hypothetical protein
LSFNSAPSTQINQLPLSITFPDDDDAFLEALTVLLKRFATTINTKEAALYNLFELVNNQQYFNINDTQSFRPVYRTVVNFPTGFTAGVPVSVPHNIAFTSTYSATRIYGAGSNTTSLVYVPLPYASPILANNIQLDVNVSVPANVTITPGAGAPSCNLAYVVIEYVKN